MGSSKKSLLARLPAQKRKKVIAELGPEVAAALLTAWRFDARPEQLAPGTKGAAQARTDWTFWLLMAGRGFGKTRAGAEWSIEQARTKPNSHGAIVAATADDARKTMLSAGLEGTEGASGILAISPADFRPTFEPSKRTLTWPNGSAATLYSAEEPDRLRGPQHTWGWCFVAGTMVLTPGGEVPLEEIRVDDVVMTRDGPRRILAASCRVAVVGSVAFSDGRNLTGTADHPVLTVDGWTSMMNLREGDSACTTGTRTLRDTSSPTLTERSFTSIASNGSACTGPSQGGTTSITSTATDPTTGLGTCDSSPPESIEGSTRSSGGRSGPSASIAVPTLSVGACGPPRSASRAGIDEQRSAEKTSAPVKSAAGRSGVAGEIFAVSVASTWEPVGEAVVYNITVEGASEYFANGVLVHNCDEIAAWAKRQEAWDQFLFGLRLGDNPQACITTTPRPLKLLRALLADPRTVTSRGSTRENRGNLAPAFYASIVGRYEGTRLGRQELDAELLEDVPGALWSLARIDELRVKEAPALRRIVIGIDPAVSTGEDSDETGIIIAGTGPCRCLGGAVEQHGFVIGDASGKHTPLGWAKEAIALYRRHKADRIVAEVNNGGDLVEANLRTVDHGVSYKKVTASRGKHIRAEPIASLYEQGKVHHLGTLARLEDQMTMWDPGDPDTKSPDRVDALVWALTELMGDGGLAPLEYTRVPTSRWSSGDADRWSSGDGERRLP